ncbi:MAG TPA: hypothetical protein VJ994_13735 [Paracoccaceae bacterium]|nr:hypothetical protein [Paracoccaceae bacterium]
MAEAEPPRVRAAHVCRGRLRLRPDGRATPETLRRIAEAAEAAPGARRVVSRPATGSVIVEADADADALRDWLESGEALRLAPREPPSPPFGRTARLGLFRLDQALRERSEGALDFRSALALTLLVGALVQLLRGRVAGPATTLLISALALIEADDR